MRILSIDPGNQRSAWLVLKDGKPERFGIEENALLLVQLSMHRAEETVLVIEQVASFGMAVGAEVFETVFWTGRFCQAWHGKWDRMKRHVVKMHLCGNMRARDANIRQALIDRFGGSAAIGKKASPGPLYGVSKDVWSALAIAITYDDQFGSGRSVAV